MSRAARLSSPVGTDPPGAPIVRQPPYHPWRGTPQGGNCTALVNSTEPGGTPMRARTLALIALLQALPAAAAGLTPLEQAGKKILVGMQFAQPRTTGCGCPPIKILRGAGAQSTACSINR